MLAALSAGLRFWDLFVLRAVPCPARATADSPSQPTRHARDAPATRPRLARDTTATATRPRHVPQVLYPIYIANAPHARYSDAPTRRLPVFQAATARLRTHTA